MYFFTPGTTTKPVCFCRAKEEYLTLKNVMASHKSTKKNHDMFYTLEIHHSYQSVQVTCKGTHSSNCFKLDD